VSALVACGGGGSSTTLGPIVVSTQYSLGSQTVTYSDGSTKTNTAVSAPVTWASDHITKTTTYTFADGGTNPVVTTVGPSTSNPTFSSAVYPSNWTTTGTVTKPSVSTSTVTYGDGYSFVQDGTSAKPFWQSTLTRNSISDPNSSVFSTTTTYDLRWGTPDQSGPGYAALFPNSAPLILSGPFTMWGQTVSGQGCAGTCGATIAAPHPEVIDAWNQGWTGNGVNILMEDWLTEAHGVTTTLLANRYAIGSRVYGFNVLTHLGIYNFDGTAASTSGMVNIGVINASYGADLKLIIGHSAPWSDAELTSAAASYATSANAVISRYTGTTVFTNFNLTNAVISKAAGNDYGLNADKEPLVKALAANSSLNSRLLVVGALNRVGFTTDPATIASYSNTAGTDVTVQSRFVVASGTTLFSTGDLAVNGVAIAASTLGPTGQTLGNVGTSYAAPRVAGYVAIVRSKFPNLDAVKTSSIMLDTARYDTLSCYYTAGGCNKAIYGQGEVSLSRALAPVGRLR